MKITIVGTGYVGLVTGACFADLGNSVVCVDINEAKLQQLRNGVVPIHEPGLEELLERNLAEGRITFSANLQDHLVGVDVLFIAVGTPSQEDGSADLSHVLAVAKTIGEHLTEKMVVVNKSTVPIGTAGKVKNTIAAELLARGLNIQFDVVSNPEFLKEGAAIKDFMSPDRIVVGSVNEDSRRLMSDLYGPFSRKRQKIEFMGVRDAEMTKYAANAMLATKISFMNEIAIMCEKFGVDVENVRRGIGSDPRIGFSFIYPGAGYGGSCFPKDVRALISMAEACGVDPYIFNAVEQRNVAQKTVLLDKIHEVVGTNLTGIKIAVWGLAFKPETDDVREASAIVMIRSLIRSGASIVAYDPEAQETAKVEFGTNLSEQIEFADDMYAAVDDVDLLLVMTEWKQFHQPDFHLLKSKLRMPLIFDGRNIYDPLQLKNLGFDYHGIGRSSQLFM